MTNDQLAELKKKELFRKLFELHYELEQFQRVHCPYDQRSEVRTVINSIEVLLMRFAD